MGASKNKANKTWEKKILEKKLNLGRAKSLEMHFSDEGVKQNVLSFGPPLDEKILEQTMKRKEIWSKRYSRLHKLSNVSYPNSEYTITCSSLYG